VYARERERERDFERENDSKSSQLTRFSFPFLPSIGGRRCNKKKKHNNIKINHLFSNKPTVIICMLREHRYVSNITPDKEK